MEILIVSLIMAVIILQAVILLKKSKVNAVDTPYLDQSIAKLADNYAQLSNLQTQTTTAAITSATAALSSKSVEMQQSIKQETEEKIQVINQDILKNFNVIRGAVEEALKSGRTEQATAIQKTFGAFENSLETLRKSVADRLTGIGETAGQIVAASKDIQSLNAILRNPQGRGLFGESQLESILGNVFGNSGLYARQHVIEGNEKVDTVVFIDADKTRMIGIDSKFPLANAMPLLTGDIEPADKPAKRKLFDSDVLKRAEEISSRYIRPPKTEDFAIMFVPSESVYALICENSSLLDRLGKMKVTLASPTTLAALLRVILSNISREKMARHADDLFKELSKISKDLEQFNEDFGLLGRHLANASSKYGDVEKRARQFSDHVDKLKRGDS
jgi:DNA recombination protein RmuC